MEPGASLPTYCRRPLVSLPTEMVGKTIQQVIWSTDCIDLLFTDGTWCQVILQDCSGRAGCVDPSCETSLGFARRNE